MATKTTKRAKGTLTDRQKAFVQEYLIDLNATAAYKRAGYKDTSAAQHNAARMMANDKDAGNNNLNNCSCCIQMHYDQFYRCRNAPG